VVLVDSAIKDVDSLSLVTAVRATSKDVSVVVMGLLPTTHDVGAFVRAGVAGFIMKDAPVDVFVGTIRAVAGGARVVPGMLNGSVLLDVATRLQARGPEVVKAAVRMTKREREVVAFIADGSSNSEIAAALGVPLHAVKGHLHRIMEKLALHTRLQVAAFAKTKPARTKPARSKSVRSRSASPAPRVA
jgi:DNA-binding NarL/FixJ family response regulator